MVCASTCYCWPGENYKYFMVCVRCCDWHHKGFRFTLVGRWMNEMAQHTQLIVVTVGKQKRKKHRIDDANDDHRDAVATVCQCLHILASSSILPESFRVDVVVNCDKWAKIGTKDECWNNNVFGSIVAPALLQLHFSLIVVFIMDWILNRLSCIRWNAIQLMNNLLPFCGLKN